MNDTTKKTEVIFMRIYLGVLVAVVVINVLVTFPCWLGGMVCALFTLWTTYSGKIKSFPVGENLAGAISFSLKGSNLHWQAKNDSKSEKYDTEIILPAFVGTTLTAVFGYFWYEEQSSREIWDIIAVVICVMAVPLSLHVLKPRKYYEWRVEKKIKPLIGWQDIKIDGVEELRAIENSNATYAGELYIVFPGNYVAEIGQYANQHVAELLSDRTAFSQFILEKITVAKDENARLYQGRNNIAMLFLVAEKIEKDAVRTGNNSLQNEASLLNDMIGDEKLQKFLSEKKWGEFTAQWGKVLAKMTELDVRIQRANGEWKESSETKVNSNRMTKEQALKILGLSAGATSAQIMEARKEAIKKYNVDHRQNLEPHIRDLVEEKFKQVNMAFDFLKTEFQKAG